MAVPPTIKLNAFYGHPSANAAGTANSYSIPTLANRHSVYIERTRNSMSSTRDYRAAGYNGLILLYILAQAQNPATGTVYGNQLVITQAEYDALPSTAFIYSDVARTTRKVRTIGTGIALQYYTDPASADVRQLLLKRCVDSLNSNPELDGMFIDNIGELLNYNDTASYPGSASVAGDGTTAGTAYTNAGFIVQEKDCLQYLRDNITSVDFTGGRTTFILAGNMLWSNATSAWNSWTMLDGIMLEDVVGYTNSGNFDSDTVIASTLAGANAFYALSSTKFIINAHQVPINASAAQNRYGLATALMWMPTTNSTTLGGRTFPRWTYRPLTVGSYTRWLEYADFDLDLGAPSGAATLTGGLYERTFTTGSVKSNPTTGTVSGVTARTGVITATPAAPPTTVPLPVAGSAISVRGDNVTSLAFTIPTAVQLNDVYVIWVEVRNVMESTVTATLAGWTAVSAATVNQSGAGALRAFQRVMDWDDPGKQYIVTFSSANDAAITGDATRGADPINPVDVASAATNNITTDTATVPSVTTVTANTRLVAAVKWTVGGGKTLGTPTGMNTTKVAEAVGSSTITIHAAEWDQTQASAAATGAKTSVMTPAQGSNTRHFAAIIALKPTTATPPAAPSNLVPLASAAAGEITVTWGLPSGTLTDLVLWESVDGGAFAEVSPQPAVTDTAIVLDRAPGTYAYRMAAQGAGGWSARTATVATALEAPPPLEGAPPPHVIAGTKLSVGIFDASGTQIVDVAATAEAVTWSEGRHGTASCDLLLSGEDATIVNAAFHFGTGGMKVRISNAVAVVWQGEIEDCAILNDKLAITAFGDWSKLALVEYSEFWSTTKLTDWSIIPYGNIGLSLWGGYSRPDLWTIEVEDTAIAAYPRRGNIFFSPAGFWFQLTSGTPMSRRTIRHLRFSYIASRNHSTVVLSLTLYAFIGNSSSQVLWKVRSDGAMTGGATTPTTVGTATVIVPENVRTVFFLVNAEAMPAGGYPAEDPATDPGPPRDNIRITDMRVLSTTAATVTPDLVVQDIIAHTNLYNPGALSESTAAISAVPLDLENLTYDAINAQDVLAELASYGMPTSVDDNNPNTIETPPVPMEVGVGPTGVVFFRPYLEPGTPDLAALRTVRELFLDGPPVEVRYSLSKLINGAYGVSDTFGTELLTDEASRARYGRLRVRSTPITNISQYLTSSYLLLEENATPKPGVEVQVGTLSEGGETRLFDAYGALVPLWQVRRGDWLVVPAPKLGPLPQAQNVFHIRIIDYKYVAKPVSRLTLTLEDSPPRLDVLLNLALAGR